MTVRVSIITVTWNAAAHLERCIQSVAAQSHGRCEYIIIDGDSTDGTQAIVARHPDTVSQFVSEPDEGIYDAMNKGVGRATGDYILFLGADDYLYDRDVIRDAVRFLAARPGADLVYGNIAVRSRDGRETIYRPPAPEEALKFLITGCLPHQATFARRDLFERIGGFDRRYKIAADYDWFLRVLGAPALQVLYLNRVVTSYFNDGLSNDLARSQAEIFAIQNGFALYQGEEWRRLRIAEYQRCNLYYRIELQRLERQLHGWRPATVPLGRRLKAWGRRLASAVVARLPRPVANQIRALHRRIIMGRLQTPIVDR